MSEGNVSEGIEDLKIMKENNASDKDRGEMDPIIEADSGFDAANVAKEVSKRCANLPGYVKGEIFSDELFSVMYFGDYHVPE